MNNKLGIKKSDICPENIAIARQFSDDEIANMPSEEKHAWMAAISENNKKIKIDIDSLKESSGLNALSAQQKDDLILLNRFSLSLADVNQMPEDTPVLITVHDEQPSEVEGEPSADVVSARYLTVKTVTYSIANGVELISFLDALNELDLRDCYKLGKCKLTSLDADEFHNLTHLLIDYHLADALNFSEKNFNDAMKEHHDNRDSLINDGFIVASTVVEIEPAKKQLSLFDEDEEEVVEFVPRDLGDEETSDFAVLPTEDDLSVALADLNLGEVR